MLHEAGAQLLDILSHNLDNYRADEMLFQYQGNTLQVDELGGAPVESIPLPLDALPFHLNVHQKGDGFIYDFRYWKNRFEEAQLELFLSVYEQTVLAMVEGRQISEPQSYLSAEAFPGTVTLDSGEQAEVRSRYGDPQPYGAWGTLYINGQPTGRTARIMLDRTVDFLENSGRRVLMEGFAGRNFPDLQKLENALNAYPGIRNAKCGLQMTDTLFWAVAAEFDSTWPIDRKDLRKHLLKQCEPYLMPAVMVENTAR
jgi:hypothetical protein